MAKPKADKKPKLRHKQLKREVTFGGWISKEKFFLLFPKVTSKYQAFAHNFEASVDGKTWVPMVEVFPFR